jgi:hypothetical protein
VYFIINKLINCNYVEIKFYNSIHSVPTGWTARGSSPVGGEFFHAVQAGPKAQPDSRKMGTGVFFLRYSAQSMVLFADILLEPSCRWFGAVILPYILPVHACHEVAFNFSLTYSARVQYEVQKLTQIIWTRPLYAVCTHAL